MSQEERKWALRYLMFLKEKRDGTIKAGGMRRRQTTKAIHK